MQSPRAKRARVVQYDTAKMQCDAASRGWNRLLLADTAASEARMAGAQPPCRATFYNFLDGKTQSPRVAKWLAKALNRSLTRYTEPMNAESERRAS